MSKRRTRKTPHAEGAHGPKTRARLIEQLQSSPPEPSTEARLEREQSRAAREGKRRLVEDRQQHDEGEKNSERTRLFDDDTREHGADFEDRDPNGLPSKGPP